MNYMKSKNITALALAALLCIPTMACGPAAIEPDDGGQNLALSSPWYYRAYGQSTDVFFNNVSNAHAPISQNGINYAWINPEFDSANRAYVQNEDDIAAAVKYGEAITITEDDVIVVDSRGGKMAAGHDGMTFFYTEMPTDRNFIFEAELTFDLIGPHPDMADENDISKQAAAGIFARDIVGEQRQVPPLEGFEELPACSNFAGTGFLYNKFGALHRDGIVSVLGTPNVLLQSGEADKSLNEDIFEGTPYIFVLERTDDGFFSSIKSTDGSYIYERTPSGNADLVKRLSADKMHIGIGSMREARVTAKNISLFDTGKSNALPTEPPIAVKEPSVKILSQKNSASEDYVFAFAVNMDGKVTLSKDGVTLFDEDIPAYNEYYIDAVLSEGLSKFEYVYAPGTAEEHVIAETYEVSLIDTAISKGDTIYVSADGMGDGSLDSPTDLISAMESVLPGQTIMLSNGEYEGLPHIEILPEHSGLKDRPIKIMAEDGGQVKINTSFEIRGDYWIFENLTIGGKNEDERVEKSPVNISTGNFNKIIRCITEYGANTGLNIGNTSETYIDAFPKYNEIINCDSRYNKDPQGANADGFAAKRTGYGTVFRGCVAYGNVDDGFDFFTNVSTGPGRGILVEQSIAHDNGANGFKVGGEAQAVDHTLINSLAFANAMAGFSDNFNPGEIRINNCVSVDNRDQNYIMRTNMFHPPENVLTNSISFRTDVSIGKADTVSGEVINSALFRDGKSELDAHTLSQSDFVSTNAPGFFGRNENGEIIWGDYMRVQENSPLMSAGTNGGRVGFLEE